MTKLLKLFSFMFLVSTGLLAQSTTVSGNVTDLLGNVWINARVIFQFQPTPNTPGPYTWSGGTLNLNPQTVITDGSGNFSISLASNTAIVPSLSSYLVSVCPDATIQCVVFQTPVTGATLNLTSLIHSSFVTINVAATFIAKAYNINMVGTVPLNEGAMIYNTSLMQLEYWNGSIWQALASGGSAGCTSANCVITNPVGPQTITQPANTNFNVITSGTGALESNSIPVLTTATGVLAGTAVLLSPAATQTVIQPGTTNLTVSNLMGNLNEELFTGATVGARVAAAAAVCGTTPCVITIPPYVAASTCNFTNSGGTNTTGCWAPTANNVTVVDLRFINGSGQAGNTLPLEKSNTYIEYHAGVLDPYEGAFDSGKNIFTVSAFADDGHNNNNNEGNLISIFSSTQRFAPSTRSIWGFATILGCTTTTASVADGAQCTGMEMDVNNNGTQDDTTDLVNALHIVTGGKRIGAGINLGAFAGSPGSGFLDGIIVNNYHTYGEIFNSVDTSRVADIDFVPPADDTNVEIRGQNAAASAVVWQINDVGQMIMPQVQVSASVGEAPGLQHIRRPVGCTTAAILNSTCTGTSIGWFVAFANTSYTLTCTLEGTTGVPVISSIAKTTTSFTVTIVSLSAVAATGTADCIAMHD